MCKTSSKKAKETQFQCAENVLPVCDLIQRLPTICENVMVSGENCGGGGGGGCGGGGGGGNGGGGGCGGVI